MVYGYANARVHGMKGLLLSRDSYAELVNVNSIDAMVELLQRTHYKKYLLDAAVNYSGSLLVEYACGMHYSDIATKMIKIVPKEDQSIINALLMKWDIINLKIVIASKKTTSEFSEVIPKIVPAGSLTISNLETIYNADEKDLLDEVKKTAFGRELFSQSMQSVLLGPWSRFKKALFKADRQSQIQTLLDTYSYLLMEKYLGPYLSDTDVRIIYELFKKEIATKNILIIERLKQSGVKDPEVINQHLVARGALDANARSALISAEKLEEIYPIIKKYFPTFEFENIHTLVDLEVELQKALSAEKIKAFHRVVLSVGTLMGFLLIKEEEMNNLRKIAKAKEFGIETTEVMKTLLIVR